MVDENPYTAPQAALETGISELCQPKAWPRAKFAWLLPLIGIGA